MKSLLAMDAFTLLNYGCYTGVAKIREIQQRFNHDYISNQYFNDNIGLIPCDGIYGRSTNKALLYALQIEEKIDVPNGVFGPSTKSKCPILSVGSTQTKFIYLLQYALYCNGYDSNGFNGQYGDDVKIAVTNFQTFSCLTADGVAGMQTWASLLVSTGDTSRKGTACDCSTTITDKKAQTLKNNGYKLVGRYLTGRYKMTSNELNTIFAAGLNVFPIFETGGTQLSYFNRIQGNKDAKTAIALASGFGFDSETIIYFCVDFDALDGDINGTISPYFSEIFEVFRRTNTTYKIGIYAPRNVCSSMQNAGYSCSSFVCDMSSGFSGNLGYPLPKDWAIDQISTITIGSGDGAIEIDNNISSGIDKGVSKINLSNTAAGIPDPYVPAIPDPDKPHIPLTNGFEYIVLSGKEDDKDRYKYNFIETALRKLHEYILDRDKMPVGSKRLIDTITWIIDLKMYSEKDIVNFESISAIYDFINIIFVRTKKELLNYLNTATINGTGKRTQAIKEFTLFGHGYKGFLQFGDDYTIDIIDINGIHSNVFYMCNSVFYSCNTGTNGEKSFAYAWQHHLGGKVKACVNKTDYEKICSADEFEKVQAKIERLTTGYVQKGSYRYPVPSKTAKAYWVYF
ncbi:MULTISPECIES: glycoside hydrolase domain-containing protein [Clostridium]|uniref:Glycoside hydrolase domain-containing protein n=1 Tax=Clostridium frigoriphilum TaxID=443253 RepID=A0ABU7UV21_9CLOT|nr:glycoside hydrolase domain-containing protein [Clostridium sp. DSM 17811]